MDHGGVQTDGIVNLSIEQGPCREGDELLRIEGLHGIGRRREEGRGRREGTRRTPCHEGSHVTPPRTRETRGCLARLSQRPPFYGVRPIFSAAPRVDRRQERWLLPLLIKLLTTSRSIALSSPLLSPLLPLLLLLLPPSCSASLVQVLHGNRPCRTPLICSFPPFGQGKLVSQLLFTLRLGFGPC